MVSPIGKIWDLAEKEKKQVRRRLGLESVLIKRFRVLQSSINKVDETLKKLLKEIKHIEKKFKGKELKEAEKEIKELRFLVHKKTESSHYVKDILRLEKLLKEKTKEYFSYIDLEIEKIKELKINPSPKVLYEIENILKAKSELLLEKNSIVVEAYQVERRLTEREKHMNSLLREVDKHAKFLSQLEARKKRKKAAGIEKKLDVEVLSEIKQEKKLVKTLKLIDRQEQLDKIIIESMMHENHRQRKILIKFMRSINLM